MKYADPLSHEEIIALAEYTVGRVVQSDPDAAELPTTIPRDAVQATLSTRVKNVDDLSQDEYDMLFDAVVAEAESRCVEKSAQSE